MRDPNEPARQLAFATARMTGVLSLGHFAMVAVFCFLADRAGYAPFPVAMACAVLLYIAWGQLKSIRQYMKEWHWVVPMNREAGMPYITHIIVGLTMASLAALLGGGAYMVLATSGSA